MNKKFKFLLGALIIALVVSVLPMGTFANADKEYTKINRERQVKLISKEEARKIAIENVKNEGVKAENIKVLDTIDDTENGKAQYYFRIKTLTHVYFIEVDAVKGKVLRFVEVLLKDPDKKEPTRDDKLEKDEKENKKKAIAEFQKDMKSANNKKLENKDDFLKDKEKYKQMKKDAIDEFKKAKDEIKAYKKEHKDKGKKEKKSNKKDDKPINEIKYLTEKQIKEIAIKKFENKNIKAEDLKIELKKDKLPPIYIVEASDKVSKIEYELVIHATTGIILEYERALY